MGLPAAATPACLKHLDQVLMFRLQLNLADTVNSRDSQRGFLPRRPVLPPKPTLTSPMKKTWTQA